jgi:hypothetical protein
MSRSDRSDTIIDSYTGLATSAAVIPLPVIDVVAISGLQVAMVLQLGNNYGQTIGKDFAKGMVVISNSADSNSEIKNLKTTSSLATKELGLAENRISLSLSFVSFAVFSSSCLFLLISSMS